MPESGPDKIVTDATADGGICPNCERERPEHFCPRCGQNDRDYARALRSVAGEFVRETFEVDSRLYRTLKLLLFKPGRLTSEFSRNRRASYMSPVRLYIFASFLFFLLLSLSGDFGRVVEMGVSEEDRENVLSEIPNEANLAAFREALSPDQRRKFDDIIARPENDTGRQIVLSATLEGDFEKRNWIERFILGEMVDILHDPSVVPRRFLANMPIAMFCVLPFLGLILAALYFRKKRFYVEHLVFAIHIQTFAFLVYAAALLLPDSGPGAVVRAVSLLIPYPYFVVALKRYYESGWATSIAKSIGAYMLYSLVLIPAFFFSIFVTG